MNDHFIPTARNSERWRLGTGKAERYTSQECKSAPSGHREAVRMALALRVSHRITTTCRVARDGTKHQRTLNDLMIRLLGVRDAENVERLIDRDRVLSGYIASLVVAEALNGDEAAKAIEIRHNAFSWRKAEFDDRLLISDK